MTSDRLLRGTLICSTLLGAAGCSPTPHYVINRPADQSSVACTDPAGLLCDIQLDVQWDGVSVRPQPELALDGNPMTGVFSTSGKSSVGSVKAALGSHTVVVSGDLAAKNTVATYTASSTFTVAPAPPPSGGSGGFTVSASPPAVLVERGKSVMTTITVTRVAPFTGAVTLALSTPPTGITSPSVVVAAGTPSGVVTLAVGASAAHGKVMLSLAATSTGVPNAGTPLTLTVGRETGGFVEANPTPYLSTVPSSRSALAGNFRVDIGTGAPSLPQPRKASFFRGTQAVGGDIGFTLGPVSNIGGAGFCANSAPMAITRGVVLSGAMPGYAAQNVVTILDLTAAAPRLIETTADMNVQQTTNGPFILFQPRVFFSQDCTVALVVGANKLGPSKHILRLLDLLTGQPIGTEVPFETATFSALLRNAGLQQEVEIKVDTGSPSAQTVVRTIP